MGTPKPPPFPNDRQHDATDDLQVMSSTPDIPPSERAAPFEGESARRRHGEREPSAVASMCCALAGLSFVVGGAFSSLMLAPFTFTCSLAFGSIGVFLGVISRDRGPIRQAALGMNGLAITLAIGGLLYISVGTAMMGSELDAGSGQLDDMLKGLRQLQGELQ